MTGAGLHRPPPARSSARVAPHLTKTRYVAGVQCPKRLWLQVYRRDLATPPDPGLRARLAAGDDVGIRARALFPGGVAVDEKHYRHAQGVEKTRRMMAESRVPAIFEAFLEHAGVRVRVDVLERLGADAWGIREVKAATRLRDEHLADVAVQRMVADGMGIRVTSAELVHVNPAYVRGEGDVDPRGLFVRADVTDATAALVAPTRERVAAMHALLQAASPPGAAPSRHCFVPFPCEFWAHCTWEKPADWVFHLPRLPADAHAALAAAGIERIADVPDDVALTPLQARVRAAVRAGAPVAEPSLAEALARLVPPLDYLDFETLVPVVPLYAGTRPYQPVPCQWSLHRVDADGTLGHREFLATLHGDPRPAFAASLLAALGDGDRPIVVWGSFESEVLAALADALPAQADRIHAARARLVDLYEVVRDHLYHPAFGGSFSLKRVAPALAPDFRWRTSAPVRMEAGDDAAAALFRLASGRVRDDHEDVHLRRALLDYCACDTRATLEVHRAVRRLAGDETPLVRAHR